jgi:hypothetical protein
MVMNVCGARFARGLHVITFNREDPDERARADACYRKMSEEVAKRGVFVGRAPLDYHDMHFAQTMPGFQQTCIASGSLRCVVITSRVHSPRGLMRRKTASCRCACANSCRLKWQSRANARKTISLSARAPSALRVSTG